MQFEVQMKTSAPEVLAFCYARVLEDWPDAVMQDLSDPDRIFSRQITGDRFFGPSVKIFMNRDALLSSRYFSSRVPSLHIEVDGDSVTVAPIGGADDLSLRLSKLPIWVHKATESNRLQAV